MAGRESSSATQCGKKAVQQPTESKMAAQIAVLTQEQPSNGGKPSKQAPDFRLKSSPQFRRQQEAAHSPPSPSQQPHPPSAQWSFAVHNWLESAKRWVNIQSQINQDMFSNSGSSGLRHEPRLIAHHWGSSAHHSDLQVLKMGEQAHPRSLIKSLSPPQKSSGKSKRTSSRKLFAQAHRVASTETFLTLIRPHPESPEKQAQRAVQKAVAGGVSAGAKPTCLGVSREFEIQIEHNREKGTSLSQIILNFDGDGLSSIKEGECERWESQTESESLLRMISA